jgi:hydrogenase-4 component F
MGILALGTGLGRLGSHGAALHAVGHSLTKGALFLVAGNILAAYGTKTIRDVTGLRRVLPASGILWLFGFLAITGSPPFSPFVSELTILRAALDRGDFVVAGFYLAFLVLIFIGMVNLVPPMVQGRVADGPARVGYRDALWSVAPPAVLGLGVLILGLHIPGPLASLLESVAQMMGGS